MNAFFDAEPELNRFELAYSGEQIPTISTDPTFSEKADKWLGMLRQVLLLGPGTFILFYMTLSVTFFYPTIGLSFGGLMTFLTALFCTYAGSGNIRNLRYLAVPGAVITMALAVVSLSLLILGRQDADLYFWHSIYLFPFVLMLAKLVQIFAGKEE